MGSIHELSDLLKSKIAAGEVIERPAYIVKELLDNAIDAHANNIRIDLEKNGLGKIIITDDGIGMDKSDLLLCYKRHTTSKIKNEDDLDNIRTMGFRGEALASIIAVAKVTIKSRTQERISGYEVLLENGEYISIKPKGMPVGTQIKIEDIFVSVPGRQKFLKSEQSEYRKIMEVITRFIIAFPEIRFDVYHEGKKIFIFPKSGIQERIRKFFSENIFQQLIPLEYEQEYIRLKGFISKPQLSYKSSRNSYIFLNQRFITENTIISTSKEAYGTLLEQANYPYLILFLEIPFHLADVNVHPRKEKVHFVNQKEILETIKETIVAVLSKTNLRYYDRRWSGSTDIFNEWQVHDGGTNTYAAKKLKQDVIEKNPLLTLSSNQSYFQLHSLYLVVSSQKGMLLFDQHAVHERILYEKLYKQFKKEIKSGERFILREPTVVFFTPHEKSLLHEHKELLNSIGFTYEEVSENEVEFFSIPHILHDQHIQKTLKEIIDELFEKGERMSIEIIGNKMISYLACRSAVKAGDKLTQKQCKELIEELKKTDNPYTCPHGRPTQVEIDLYYFHKLFKRT